MEPYLPAQRASMAYVLTSLYRFFITIFGRRYLFHFRKCCVFMSNAVKACSVHILTIINYLFNVRSYSKLRKQHLNELS